MNCDCNRRLSKAEKHLMFIWQRVEIASITLVILKLNDLIDCSWWFVFCPVWMFLGTIVFIFMLIVALIATYEFAEWLG